MLNDTFGIGNESSGSNTFIERVKYECEGVRGGLVDEREEC